VVGGSKDGIGQRVLDAELPPADDQDVVVAAQPDGTQRWAFDADGRLLGIKGELFQDHGANTPYGIALPYNSGTNLIGPYPLPAYDLKIHIGFDQ